MLFIRSALFHFSCYPSPPFHRYDAWFILARVNLHFCRGFNVALFGYTFVYTYQLRRPEEKRCHSSRRRILRRADIIKSFITRVTKGARKFRFSVFSSPTYDQPFPPYIFSLVVADAMNIADWSEWAPYPG